MSVSVQGVENGLSQFRNDFGVRREVSGEFLPRFEREVRHRTVADKFLGDSRRIRIAVVLLPEFGESLASLSPGFVPVGLLPSLRSGSPPEDLAACGFVQIRHVLRARVGEVSPVVRVDRDFHRVVVVVSASVLRAAFEHLSCAVDAPVRREVSFRCRRVTDERIAVIEVRWRADSASAVWVSQRVVVDPFADRRGVSNDRPPSSRGSDGTLVSITLDSGVQQDVRRVIIEAKVTHTECDERVHALARPGSEFQECSVTAGVHRRHARLAECIEVFAIRQVLVVITGRVFGDEHANIVGWPFNVHVRSVVGFAGLGRPAVERSEGSLPVLGRDPLEGTIVINEVMATIRWLRDQVSHEVVDHLRVGVQDGQAAVEGRPDATTVGFCPAIGPTFVLGDAAVLNDRHNVVGNLWVDGVREPIERVTDFSVFNGVDAFAFAQESLSGASSHATTSRESGTYSLGYSMYRDRSVAITSSDVRGIVGPTQTTDISFVARSSPAAVMGGACA